jgi:putative transcriptional regulator
MSKIGKALISAVKDAKKRGMVKLHASPNVAALRKKLKLTQQKFAEKYHINPETIKKWEQHKREPDSISRAYLKCIEKNPAIIDQLVNS